MAKPKVHIVDVTDFNLPDGTKSTDWFMNAFEKLDLLGRVDIESYDGTAEVFPDLDSLKEGTDGIIITGSSGAVFEEKHWIPALLEFIKDAHKRKIHMLGVCFGHHAIAVALGGEVMMNPRGRELGTYPVYLTDEGGEDPLLGHFGFPELVNLSHRTHVTELPEGATCLAFNQTTPVQAFRIGNSMGVQFHPELTPRELKQLVLMFRNVLIRKENFADSEEHLERIVSSFQQTPASMAVLEKFVASIEG